MVTETQKLMSEAELKAYHNSLRLNCKMTLDGEYDTQKKSLIINQKSLQTNEVVFNTLLCHMLGSFRMIAYGHLPEYCNQGYVGLALAQIRNDDLQIVVVNPDEQFQEPWFLPLVRKLDIRTVDKPDMYLPNKAVALFGSHFMHLDTDINNGLTIFAPLADEQSKEAYWNAEQAFTELWKQGRSARHIAHAPNAKTKLFVHDR